MTKVGLAFFNQSTILLIPYNVNFCHSTTVVHDTISEVAECCTLLSKMFEDLPVHIFVCNTYSLHKDHSHCQNWTELK